MEPASIRTLRPAVLQHHGGQPLLDLLHRPLHALTGGVRLGQQHAKVLLAFRRRRLCGAPPPALVQAVVADEGLQAAERGARLAV